MAKKYPEIAAWLRSIYLAADRFADELDPERLVHHGEDRYGERRRELVRALDRIGRAAAEGHQQAMDGQTILKAIGY